MDSEGVDVFAASECSQEPELEFDGSCTTGTLFACGLWFSYEMTEKRNRGSFEFP